MPMEELRTSSEFKGPGCLKIQDNIRKILATFSIKFIFCYQEYRTHQHMICVCHLYRDAACAQSCEVSPASEIPNNVSTRKVCLFLQTPTAHRKKRQASGSQTFWFMTPLMFSNTSMGMEAKINTSQFHLLSSQELSPRNWKSIYVLAIR